MSLNMNQFSMGPVAGQLDLQTNPNPAVMSVRFDPSNTTDKLGFGVGVVLSDLGSSDSAGPPIVALRAGDGNKIEGVRIFSTKQGEVEGGQVTEIATAGAVVFMKAAGALARGVVVTLDVSADATVKAVGSDTSFGVTLDKATAAEQLIRVRIIADGVEGT